MKCYLITALIFFVGVGSFAQHRDFQSEISAIQKSIDEIAEKEDELRSKLENVKLERVRYLLKEEVIPTLRNDEELILHSAMALVYDEYHEQAKWVAHIITSDVASGNIGRSNDFRVDPKIKTGSAVEEDYFLKEMQSDGTYKYDGYGFDRGHLAPSADFRWSAEALSESYYYSNMSPQRPDFNRISWALLEDVLRDYSSRHQDTDLYVITGPVLHDDLPVLERSINRITIPEFYYKIALDKNNKQAIAFLMPNALCEYPTEYYAVSIDSIESLTGIDFFPTLEDALEKKLEALSDVSPWLSDKMQDDKVPIHPTKLPRNHFNTVQAKRYVGSNDQITVCGTVVSTKLSAKGNIFINLDKSFPNQIFTVSIFNNSTANFSYEPHTHLEGKAVCVRGKVTDFNGTPSMVIENENAIRLFEE